MVFFTPTPPPQTPAAEIRSVAPTVAHNVASIFFLKSRDILSPTEQIINLLSAANHELQIDPIRIRRDPVNKTLTYSLGQSTFFRITISDPVLSSRPISIIGHPNVLKAIKQTIGVGDEVNSKERLRDPSGAKEILLTPAQFGSLYEQMDTFIKTLKTLEGPSTHRSAAPSQEPPVLALWQLDRNTRS